MKNPFLLPLVIVSVFTSVPGLAADEIQWGEPVNGLRIGVDNPPTVATADQNVTFKLIAQNVSQQPIILPTPESFVLKSNPDSDDYHVSPLAPVVEPNPGRYKPSLYSSPESSLPAISVETTFTVELEDNPAALNAYLGTFVPTLLMANADDHLPPWVYADQSDIR